MGLPYTGTVKSMRVNTGDQSGTSRGRRQTITRLTLLCAIPDVTMGG